MNVTDPAVLPPGRTLEVGDGSSPVYVSERGCGEQRSALSSPFVRGQWRCHVVMMRSPVPVRIGGHYGLNEHPGSDQRRELGELSPIAHAGAGEQAGDVVFDGAHRQEQLLGDVAVRPSLGDQQQHLQLASRDAERP